MKNRLNFLWFLLGLGSQLQVLFSLSITEIILLFWAPFLVSQEYPYLRRYGLLKLFWLTVFVFVGCLLSLAYNQAEGFRWVRGLSVTGLMICTVVVGCRMIRTEPAGLKWMFVGSTISAFLCTFVFQKATEVMIAGSNDATEIMGGTLYWIQRLDSVLRLPCYYNYLGVPTWYSFFASLFMAMYSIFTSASGRSAALCLLGAAAMVIVGGRKQSSMRKISKHFLLVCILAIVGIMAAKAGYQYAALSGVLGEKARDKYEQQTRGGSGIMHLLIAGRAASFVGFLAIADSPLFGKGYWAPDTEGYEFEFLKKYGDEEDLAFWVRREQNDAVMGIVRPTRLISAHSHITAFWLYFGIAGLLYWLYVLYVIFRYVKEDCWIVPQWFFWLAAGTPALLWSIFFSPFHSRFGLPLMIVAMLMCRAIREGRYVLPYSMMREIQIANQK